MYGADDHPIAVIGSFLTNSLNPHPAPPVAEPGAQDAPAVAAGWPMKLALSLRAVAAAIRSGVAEWTPVARARRTAPSN
jgi:hypothetical protein